MGRSGKQSSTPNTISAPLECSRGVGCSKTRRGAARRPSPAGAAEGWAGTAVNRPVPAERAASPLGDGPSWSGWTAAGGSAGRALPARPQLTAEPVGEGMRIDVVWGCLDLFALPCTQQRKQPHGGTCTPKAHACAR